MIIKYNAGLIREQFLYHEMRILASLLCEELSKEKILKKLKKENFIQLPTVRMRSSIANACFEKNRNFEAEVLVDHLPMLHLKCQANQPIWADEI